MLTFKTLRWSNCFSYGENNYIDFDKETLTQLVGINGCGKTSISLILQEVLYGKNIKNIKKQDIANNKSGQSGYYATLLFNKDGDEYIVELDRKSNLKFRLYKNEMDISSHTSLNTYKTLAKIIGIDDFKIFCQLIYQHSTDSLDFLTATDTNRKRFLISLLQLDRYIELHELFKDKVRAANTSITGLTASTSLLESWINKHQDMDLIKQHLIGTEPINQDWYERQSSYKNKLKNLNALNRKIVLNEQYRADMDDLDPKYYMGIAPVAPVPSNQKLRTYVSVAEEAYRISQAKITKLNGVKGECPECLQKVDEKQLQDMVEDEIVHRDIIKGRVGELWAQIPKTEKIEKEIKKYKTEKTNFERISQLIDPNGEFTTYDKLELTNKFNDITELIIAAETLAKEVVAENLKISAHNSRVDVVKSQLAEFKKELQGKNIDLMEKENLATILELLKKTFGTNGLVSYKIESSVKELEKKINSYLNELTHFQIYFKLAGEKLNIEVVDDLGNKNSISNLSSGERARVNIATILAIRSILSSLTSTKINLLFLDEVIGVIDAEGKEKLSEILLKEDLNTFIVSHDWTHPLIPRINIVKEKHISRIEHD